MILLHLPTLKRATPSCRVRISSSEKLRRPERLGDTGMFRAGADGEAATGKAPLGDASPGLGRGRHASESASRVAYSAPESKTSSCSRPSDRDTV
jgi:hypothetical protein